MKLIRYIAYAVFAVACLLGGLISLDVFSKQQFESLPRWSQVTLIICYAISGIVTMWGFVDYYRRVRRARRAAHPTLDAPAGGE